MPERFNRLVRGVFLASRCSMAPLALGLCVALIIVLVQFFRELTHAVTGFAAMDDGAVMIAVLKLVDLALSANLVVIIVGAAAEMLVRGSSNPEAEPSGRSGDVAFGLVELKLFASISAIAAIYLLERFINVHPLDKTELLWEILILLTFVASGVMLAWMDRLTADRH
jgi:uncharacterized protein (TIGR00645 family)